MALEEILPNPVVRSIATIAIVALLVAVLVGFVRRTLIANIADNDLRYRAAKVASVIGNLVVVIVLLTQLGGRLSAFTVAIGAASAGIAFALQEVIASFAGWLAVALGGFYKVGDRVQLGGIKGDVIDIGLIRTTIMEIGGWVNGDLYNGRIVRVANSFVFKEPVFNYSGRFSFVWDEIVIPIRYGSDYDLAREVLGSVAREVVGRFVEPARREWVDLVKSYRIEDARVEPLVTMVANDNWVEFTMRYVVDHRERRIAKDQLFSRILRMIEESDGKLAMASATFHLVEAAPLKVSLESSARLRETRASGATADAERAPGGEARTRGESGGDGDSGP
ncbi:MAG: mechanosensitive ion channel family protein [Deltaproteobacteria bacterium]|nr:mechanosensitive ion channel family protein [Deltaproteobacteria bacterium]